jgi:alkanesulfonate monooxygenase SsuD/methylene tetrahydromethanopterin reductase-like flavin-dependent oxidoreductase (luciferase family)
MTTSKTMVVAFCYLGTVVLSCSPSTASLAGDITALESQMAERSRAISEAESRVDVLLERTAYVVETYRKATEKFKEAEEALILARQAAEGASRILTQAIGDYKVAQRAWQTVTVTVLAAASSPTVGKHL